METRILNELERTNDLLQVLIYLLFIVIFVWLLRTVTVFTKDWKRISDRAANKVFQKLYKKEKLLELIGHCERELRKDPKNPYALFWKAKAQHKLGRSDGIKECLSTLLDYIPSWKEGWMNAYTEKPKSEPDGVSKG